MREERFFCVMLFILPLPFIFRIILECMVGNYEWLVGLIFALPIMSLLPIHILRPGSIDRTIDRYIVPVLIKYPYVLPAALIFCLACMNYFFYAYLPLWAFLFSAIALNALCAILISLYVYTWLRRAGWLEA